MDMFESLEAFDKTRENILTASDHVFEYLDFAGGKFSFDDGIALENLLSRLRDALKEVVSHAVADDPCEGEEN